MISRQQNRLYTAITQATTDLRRTEMAKCMHVSKNVLVFLEHDECIMRASEKRVLLDVNASSEEVQSSVFHQQNERSLFGEPVGTLWPAGQFHQTQLIALEPSGFYMYHQLNRLAFVADI